MTIETLRKIVEAQILDGEQTISIRMTTPYSDMGDISCLLQTNGYRCTACNPTDTYMIFEII